MSRTALCLATAFAVACLSLSASAQLSFSPAQYGVPASGESVATGDFNGDGLPDLAVGNGHTISVFLATEPGHYAAHSDFDIASEASEIVVADFNGDGHLDILAGDGPMTLLLGDGNGNFTPQPVNISNPDPHLGGGVVALAAAD